jgi:SAM-dependent methyltransferase
VKSKALYSSIFTRHAAAYRERHQQIKSVGRNRALELLNVQPGERVVDLACGPGNVSRVLTAAGAQVVGIDLASGMLRLAVQDVPEAYFARMDLEDLALSRSSFDAAFCGHGFQFVPRLDRALGEAHRVLRPGGRLAASVPSRRAGKALDDLIGPLANCWLNPRVRPVDAGDRSLLEDPESFERAARAADFTQVRAEWVQTTSRWENAASYVRLQSSWWDMAARMEGVAPERVSAYEEQLREVLEERFGKGSFETAGLDVVLYGVR